MIKISGADSIMTLKIHSTDLCRCSDIPILNINTDRLLINLFVRDNDNFVLVAPDAGNSKQCLENVKDYNISGALIHKGRCQI